MSHFHIFYIVSFLIYSIHTQQDFITDQWYQQYANPYGDTIPEDIKVAYPINHCTKTGNHMTSPYSSINKYQCSYSGSVVYKCSSWFDNVCPSMCDLTSTYYETSAAASPPEEVCSNGRDTTSTNYMTIAFYCGLTNDTRPNTCPSDTSMFFPRGIAKFATNICVAQPNGDYLMATCNNETAELGLYDSIACNNRKSGGVIPGVYRQYTRSCDNYAYPDPTVDSCNYFRRVTECMVNGV
eukprot:987121_1